MLTEELEPPEANHYALAADFQAPVPRADPALVPSPTAVVAAATATAAAPPSLSSMPVSLRLCLGLGQQEDDFHEPVRAQVAHGDGAIDLMGHSLGEGGGREEKREKERGGERQERMGE